MSDSFKSIHIEKAKNGLNTCKIFSEGKWKFAYSKYDPRKNIHLPPLSPTEPCLVLGAGLGYEILELRKKTKGPITVIEQFPEFIQEIKSQEETKPLLDDPNIRFVVGSHYLSLSKSFTNRTIISTRVTEYFIEFYSEVTKFLNQSSQKRKNLKVLFLKHITIANDCMDALKNLGYEVYRSRLKNRLDRV